MQYIVNLRSQHLCSKFTCPQLHGGQFSYTYEYHSQCANVVLKLKVKGQEYELKEQCY